MWLFLIMRSYLGWSVSVGRRILMQAAPQVALVVVATIIAQLSRLLAFFLPVKIIILIGSDRVPRYFPSFFADFERQPLVIWLGIATIGFYALCLVAEKVVDHFSERTADKVAAHTAKLALFPDQDETLRDACSSLAESFAAVVFGVLAISLLAWVYPIVAIVIGGWTLAAILFVALVGTFSKGFREWLDEHAKGFIDGASALGFFAVTATIILEFILGADFPILIAIISVLLTRRLMQQLGRIFKNALALYPRRLAITPLVLRSHVWTGEKKQQREDVWELLETGDSSEWLGKVFEQVTGEKTSQIKISRWHETGVIDLLSFDIAAVCSTGEARTYLVKLFGRKRHVAGSHEATLFGSVPVGQLPALAFLGSVPVGEHLCQVFEAVSGDPIPQREFKETEPDLIADCWRCEPPQILVQRYKRSHRPLGQRLEGAPLGRLLVVARSDQRDHVAAFGAQLPEICRVVNALPLVIHNPDIRTPHVHRLDDGRPVALQWGRWRLEPIGAGWSTSDLDQLPFWLDKAREGRSDLASVAAAHAQLAALMLEADSYLDRERYQSVVEMLPAILDAARSCGIAGPNETLALPRPEKSPRPARKRDEDRAQRTTEKQDRDAAPGDAGRDRDSEERRLRRQAKRARLGRSSEK